MAVLERKAAIIDFIRAYKTIMSTAHHTDFDAASGFSELIFRASDFHGELLEVAENEFDEIAELYRKLATLVDSRSRNPQDTELGHRIQTTIRELRRLQTRQADAIEEHFRRTVPLPSSNESDLLRKALSLLDRHEDPPRRPDHSA